MVERTSLESERREAGVRLAIFDASVQLGVGGMTRRLEAAAAAGGSARQIFERFAVAADDVTGGHTRRRDLLEDPTLSDGPMDLGS